MQAAELYQTVSAKMVALLEQGGLLPWRRPWSQQQAGFPLRHTGEPYKGCNCLWLWVVADANGYANPTFMTFAQAKEYGGCVRKGEKSDPVLYCQPLKKKATKDDGSEGEESFWLAKTYRVFNVEQIDGLPERFTIKPENRLDPAQRIEHAETFLSNLNADIRTGNAAYYRPSEDSITLPPFESFESPDSFYSTAVHEAIHWSGAKHRLDRDLTGYGNRERYSKEEITAELGSVFVTTALGIAPPDLGQHAAYLDHWIRSIKADPRFIFQAAAAAQRAADYLHSLQPNPEA